MLVLSCGFVILVAIVLVVFVVSGYNSLVTLRNRYKNAYSQIDVQLKRRYDLIPNLVETAKGYLAHERGTLEAVIAADERPGSRAAAPRREDRRAVGGRARQAFGLGLQRQLQPLPGAHAEHGRHRRQHPVLGRPPRDRRAGNAAALQRLSAHRTR